MKASAIIIFIIVVSYIFITRKRPRIPESETVFLDTETTGLAKGTNEILEIAIVDYDGNILLNSLVKPRSRRSWKSAQKIHGITPEDVCKAPLLIQLLPKVNHAIRGKRLVIYNAQFDTWFFPDGLRNAGEIHCAMREYTKTQGIHRWSKLSVAANVAQHKWTGQQHRALSDALACRSVWIYLNRTR